MSNDSVKILYGGQSESVVPKEKSLGQLIINKLKDLGDKIILINGTTGEQFVASEILRQSIQLAWSLHESGIRSNNTVSIIMENCVEYLIVCFGTAICGATFAPFNSMYSEIELRHVMGLSCPKIIFSKEKYEQKIKNATINITSIENIVLIDSSSKANIDSRVSSLDSFIQKFGSVSKKSFPCRDVIIEDETAIILTSSGTTGLPKGVEHAHSTLFKYHKRFNAEYLQATQMGYGLVRLVPVTWAHAYGLFNTVSLILNHFTVVFLTRYNAKDYLKSIETYQITYSYLLTPILVMLSKNGLVNQYNLSSIKYLSSGGMPLSGELTLAVQKRLGPITIRQNYGMTEMMSIMAQTDSFCTPGSIGYLRPGVWGKVIDIETGKLLGPNQAGEMSFKGGIVMKCYLKNPNATRDFLSEDGWCRTGDIGYYNENNEWFCIDRLKELIKYKGNQVAPAELEGIILEHPKVGNVGVVGVPNEEAGELPMAFVVLKKDEIATSKEICDFVAERVSPVKRLRGGVQFVEEIPTNITGKILRRELKKMVPRLTSKL